MKKLLVVGIALGAMLPVKARADEYSFFKYDAGALNGYASYDAWRASACSASSSSGVSTETVSESGHCTWSVSSGIDLITKALNGLIILFR